MPVSKLHKVQKRCLFSNGFKLSSTNEQFLNEDMTNEMDNHDVTKEVDDGQVDKGTLDTKGKQDKDDLAISLKRQDSGLSPGTWKRYSVRLSNFNKIKGTSKSLSEKSGYFNQVDENGDESSKNVQGTTFPTSLKRLSSLPSINRLKAQDLPSIDESENESDFEIPRRRCVSFGSGTIKRPNRKKMHIPDIIVQDIEQLSSSSSSLENVGRKKTLNPLITDTITVNCDMCTESIDAATRDLRTLSSLSMPNLTDIDRALVRQEPATLHTQPIRWGNVKSDLAPIDNEEDGHNYMVRKDKK